MLKVRCSRTLLPVMILCLLTGGCSLNKHQAELVSATALDHLTTEQIRHKYPAGIQVCRSTLSADLKQRLETIAADGFRIDWLETDSQKLRQITSELLPIAQPEAFLKKIYESSDTACFFLVKEVLPHCLRRTDVASIRELQTLSPAVYAQRWPYHHFWKNIGYASADKASPELLHWLKQTALQTEALNAAGFRHCGLFLSAEQIKELSRLIALDYLSNLVRGRLYFEAGSKLTYFRKMAVDSVRIKSNEQ